MLKVSEHLENSATPKTATANKPAIRETALDT